MDARTLERLQQIILGDRRLWPPLLGLKRRGEFAEAVSRIANLRGLAVGPAEVEEALGVGRARWRERGG